MDCICYWRHSHPKHRAGEEKAAVVWGDNFGYRDTSHAHIACIQHSGRQQVHAVCTATGRHTVLNPEAASSFFTTAATRTLCKYRIYRLYLDRLRSKGRHNSEHSCSTPALRSVHYCHAISHTRVNLLAAHTRSSCWCKTCTVCTSKHLLSIQNKLTLNY